MGNSGSNNINGEITDLGEHNLHLYNSQSHDSLQTRYQQVKVLPDSKNVPSARLRGTNNGKILQSGGTISGRKDFSNSGIYRSHSISSQQPNELIESKSHAIPNKLMQRSQTQATINRYGKQKIENNSILNNQQLQHLNLVNGNYKGYGSEPDLNANHITGPSSQENLTNLHPPLVNAKQPAAKLSRETRKIKAHAPEPPNDTVNRFGWKAINNNKNVLHSVPPATAKKLRLFKTKAETQKNCLNSAKLDTDVVDSHFKRSSLNRTTVSSTQNIFPCK